MLAALNAALWWRYRGAARARGIGPQARRELARIGPALHLVGHGAPIGFFLAALIAEGAGPWLGLGLLGLGGAAALIGGALWKFTVITRASYSQGFALPRMPQRGSGARAAPVRFEAP